MIQFILVLLIVCCQKDPAGQDEGIPLPDHERADFYVAITGNDRNPGTYEKPFASWQKAFDIARPGDTVFIREGTYYPDDSRKFGVYIKDKSGTPDRRIHIFAYPGESPVLDCLELEGGDNNYGIYLVSASNWHLKGLSVINVSQHGLSKMATGLAVSSGNNNILEQLKLYHNEGPGLGIYKSSENNLVLNCDSWDNYDPHTSVDGGNADGFAVAFITERNGNERKNIFHGCRAWNNSDDGYDFYGNEGTVVMDSCWAFLNGFADGDGNGFKLGDTFGNPENSSQRDLMNCIAYKNTHNGFYQNSANMKMTLKNNTSYDNDLRGFYFSNYNNEILFSGNISYQNGMANSFMSNMIHENNSWNTGIPSKDDDFVSIDSTGITSNRQSNGSLPTHDFLKLKN